MMFSPDLDAIVPMLCVTLAALASVGMPALNGFVGEFLTMLGGYLWNPRFVVVAGLGVILSAVYMLSMFQKVYLGEVTNQKNATLPDLQPREWASVLPICAMAILMGVLPSIFLAPMEPSVKKVVQRVQAVRTVVAQAVPASKAVAAVPAAAPVVAAVQGQ